MTDHLVDLAREGIEVFNRGDWDRMRSLVAPESSYEETGTGRRLEGIDQILTALQEWRDAAPDLKGTVSRALGGGDTTAIEVLWEGTQTGPLAGPAGVLPPSDRPFRMYSTLWQRWRDDQVIEGRNHVDVLGMLAQLGALPAST